MAKKYLNGYDSFRITPVSGSLTPIDFNLRFQGFTESVEETYIVHELLNGEIAEKYLYSHYYWEVDYSALAEAGELIKMKRVLNYIQQGLNVILTPHTDVIRNFFITTVKDKLTLGRHYGGANSSGEKDFTITFRTKFPITSSAGINWVELTDGGTPISDIDNQYNLLTDETGDYITDEAGGYLIIKTT